VGADVIGVNCSADPPASDAVERMVKATDKPISAQSNAGPPADVGDRRSIRPPEYMASYARA
jgi:homocysteine S-methyltransferase